MFSLSTIRNLRRKYSPTTNLFRAVVSRLQGKNMQKVIKHTATNLYLTPKGFTAKNADKALRYASYDAADEALEAYAQKGKNQQRAADKATIESVPEVVDPNIKQNTDGSSYGVTFIRQKDVKGETVAIRKLTARRFATRNEAVHHGSRFMLIENHLGFQVLKTADKVNAYINKKNGTTNPEIGKARVGRAVPAN